MSDKITAKEIKEINGLHKMVVEAEKGTLEWAMKAGVLLKKAKDSLEHGEWLPWLAKNCPDISDRNASSYMRLAMPKNEAKIKSAATSNQKRVADLSIREANRLIMPERTEAQKEQAKAKKEAKKKAEAPEATEKAVKKYIESLSADDLAKLLLEAFDDDYVNSLIEQLQDDDADEESEDIDPSTATEEKPLERRA